MSGVSFHGPQNKATVTLVVQALPQQDMTLKAYTTYYKQAAAAELTKQGYYFEMYASNEAELGGQEAQEMTFILRKKPSYAKGLGVWTIHNGRVYTLTYSALQSDFDEFADDFASLAQSLSFLQKEHRIPE